MMLLGRYIFKRADTAHELEQVHRLNYRTFVGEVHQYPDSGTGILVDKFHHKNVYFVALRDGHVVGMTGIHGEPPFSVADRLPDPSVLQAPGVRPIEIRLLAVEPDERNSAVLPGVLWSLYSYARDNGYTHLFISGVADRVPFYKKLGFEALGPAVPCGDSSFVPMRVSVPGVQESYPHFINKWLRRLDREAANGNGKAILKVNGHEANGSAAELMNGDDDARHIVGLLPGPVTTAPAVREAFHHPPIYHRGSEFIGRFEGVRRQLGNLVNARDVALFNGSGTLANEAVAATIASGPLPGRGLLLVNGEFGHRLAKQAARFGLNPRVLAWPWGKPWDLSEVEAALAEEPEGSWIWGVHQESSTGILNDLPGLVRLAQARNIRPCFDCISSLGAVPIDLRHVYLATGATGKSLGSYAGAALVFTDARRLLSLDMSRVPSYLDLPATLETVGPRYTFPSPTLAALEAALGEYTTPDRAQARYDRYADLGAYVRQQLRDLGLTPLADDACASPVVTSFSPPSNETCEAFVKRCRSWGFAIGGQSGYLAERRLVQIATMGAVSREDCGPLFDCLRRWLQGTAPLAG